MIETNKYFKKLNKDYKTLIRENCTLQEFKAYNKEILFEFNKYTLSQKDYDLFIECANQINKLYNCLKITLAINNLKEVLLFEFVKTQFSNEKKLEKNNEKIFYNFL